MQEGTVPVPEGSASGLLGDAVLAAQLLGDTPSPPVIPHGCSSTAAHSWMTDFRDGSRGSLFQGVTWNQQQLLWKSQQ